MFKYQLKEWIVIEHPNMRPIQAQIIERMKNGSDGRWYRLIEKGTGNKVAWIWEDENTGESREVDWYPEKDLLPITHSLDKDNPNATFKSEKLSSDRLISYSQFVVVKRLIEETGAEVEGNVAKISYRKAKEIIKTLEELTKAQRETT